MRALLTKIADDARKIAEAILAGIMAPAVASTAADLIAAGVALENIIITLAWIIVIARAFSTALELWERYFERQRE